MKYLFKKEDFNIKSFRRFKSSIIKFPINFWTVEGGEFLGDLLTDGSYQSNGYLTYSNSEIENILSNLRSTNKLFSGKILDVKKIEKEIALCNNPQEIAKKLNGIVKNFGIYCNIRFREKTKLFEVQYSGILRIILDKLGIQRGERLLTNPELPELIKVAPKHVICSFLRRVITNEATITHDGQVCIKQSILSFFDSPKLLDGYEILFKRLGIKTTKPRISKKYKGRYGIHVAWEVYTRPYDLQKIIKKVGIESKRKRLKVKKFLKSAKRFKLPREDRIKQIIDIAKKLKRPFKVDDLLKLTNLKRSAIQDYLYRLMKKDFVIRNTRRFYPNGSEPFLYRLTKRGKKFGDTTNSI
jgi:predicted transcriptional regulator